MISTQVPPTVQQGAAYLIVDDHVLIREGVVRVFSDIRPTASLFEASSFAEAARILQSDSGRGIDTVLLDLNLPDSRGLETLQRIKAVAPHLLVGVISGTDDDHLAMQCLQQGASAFVPKHGPIDQFVQGITALATGGVYFPRELLCRVTGSLTGRLTDGAGSAQNETGGVRLTQRQTEVLRLLRKGWTNQAIAEELGISTETVKLHVSALLRAYKVSSRVQLILACASATHAH
jgi:DNA-binding NarL/FixJ family response regulator